MSALMAVIVSGVSCECSCTVVRIERHRVRRSISCVHQLKHTVHASPNHLPRALLTALILLLIMLLMSRCGALYHETNVLLRPQWPLAFSVGACRTDGAISTSMALSSQPLATAIAPEPSAEPSRTELGPGSTDGPNRTDLVPGAGPRRACVSAVASTVGAPSSNAPSRTRAPPPSAATSRARPPCCSGYEQPFRQVALPGPSALARLLALACSEAFEQRLLARLLASGAVGLGEANAPAPPPTETPAACASNARAEAAALAADGVRHGGVGLRKDLRLSTQLDLQLEIDKRRVSRSAIELSAGAVSAPPSESS